MSSFDKKTKTSQQSTSTSNLTDWSKQQYESQVGGVLDSLKQFNSNTPFRAYDGNMVADMSDPQKQARQYASSKIGSNDAIFNDVEGIIRDAGATNLTPTEVSYRTFDQFDPGIYYNPFEREVVDANSAYFDEALDKSLSDNQARATMSGSYGGSRHGIADAELRRTSLMDKAKMQADMRYQGYEGARNQFNTDSQGIYTADTRNADANYAAQRDNLNNKYASADALTGLAGSKQAAWQSEVAMLEELGASEREIEQAKLLAERAEFDRESADDWKRFQIELQTRLGLLGTTPMLTTNSSSGSSTSKTSDPLGTISSLTGGFGGLFDGLGAAFGAAK